MRRPTRSIFLAILVLLGAGKTFAGAEISRFSILAGFAQSAAESAEVPHTVRREEPVGFAFSIDHSYSGPYFLTAEHMRSMGSGSTAVGFTGGGFKFYPWLSPLHFKNRNVNGIESASLSYRGYSVYVGATMGFAQASIPSDGSKLESLAAGMYVNLKGGAEYPLGDKWGLRGEFNYATTVMGSGSIAHLNVLFGAFLDL